MRWQGEVRGPVFETKDSVQSRDGKDEVSSRAVLVFGIVNFCWSMLFWVQSFTGNVVSEVGRVGKNFAGVVLFGLAVVGFFVYAKKREREVL